MTDDPKLIKGAFGGGGGGTPDPPTIEPDTLQSLQFFEVIDLIGEGEIEGIGDGSTSADREKAIYLDDTPIRASDGTLNFKDVVTAERQGTLNQNAVLMKGGGDTIQSEQAVGLEVFEELPITKTITNTETDRVRFTVTIPSLFVVENDGDIRGSEVQLAFQVQYNGGGFNQSRQVTIRGKNQSPYTRDITVDINGEFPVDIRVKRNSPDSTDRSQRKTIWTSFTEIIEEKLRYPQTALCYTRINAKQFSSIPSRKFLVRGLKVKIPSNATVSQTQYPGRITYTGVWDGTFSTPTWTNDPAWCLWDLLTNDRYGCGIPESSLDRYDFYSISQYCNALVSDGKGGQEPRFACNFVINTRQELYNVIQEMTSIFRGISYYAAGSLVLRQDKPSDSQYVIGPSNVIDGIFNYSGAALKSRHTTATVAWQDYGALGEVKFEYVEDQDAVAKYGVVNKDIKAAGCYSQGQATRLGKWALISEQNLTETVTFSVGIDSGLVLRPGTVIDIADPLRGGTRRSGRVSSATTGSIVVDSDTDLSVDLNQNPTLTVVLPKGVVQTRGITNISGTTITLDSPALSQAPNAGAVWLIQTDDIQSQQFRVLSVSENEDSTFTVNALKYNETVYDAIESDVEIEERDITNVTAKPGAVTNLTADEFLYADASNVKTAVSLSWTSPGVNADTFVVNYRLDNDNLTNVTTSSPELEIRGLKAGTLEVEVTAVSSSGRQGPTTEATFTLAGKTAVPADVQNLTIETISVNSARLRWDETTDLDVKVGGKVIIRHSNKTDGSGTWSSSSDLVAAAAGSATEAVVPLIEGEILVKFEYILGLRSANATSVLIDFPETLNNLLVLSQREDQDAPPFQGAKTNCNYDPTYDALVLEATGLIDDQTDFDDIVDFSYIGPLNSSGTYVFADTLDLEAVYSIDISRHLVASGFYPTNTIDTRLELCDTWDE
ncbi:MAG: phage tail protein, partial [Halieaceae bacterium]